MDLRILTASILLNRMIAEKQPDRSRSLSELYSQCRQERKPNSVTFLFYFRKHVRGLKTAR